MPKTPLTHHLVALWFADVAGYSDRAAEDERSALQLIEILQSLSRDTVRRYEGRVVKFMGDAARSVLAALGLSLTEREKRRFLKLSTANVEAYEFYLRGRKLFQSLTRQNMEFARQMFLRAVVIDPDFSSAWVVLAITYVDLYL